MSSARRGPRARFEPRFTVGLFYLFAFFLLYCLLLVLPELATVLERLPPGPEQQEAAREAARRALGPRLWIAFLGALATTALAARTGALPGLRRG